MATYNSSSVARLGYPRGTGVYPVKDAGVISLGNVTLTANDLLPICYIPQGSFLSKIVINFPILNPSGTTLAISLLDNLASPTTYISASTKGSNFSALTTFSELDFIAATWGTTYGFTARSIGASGSPVVVWAKNVQLQLKATATASAATGGTTNITYQVEFSPGYDMGV